MSCLTGLSRHRIEPAGVSGLILVSIETVMEPYHCNLTMYDTVPHGFREYLRTYIQYKLLDATGHDWTASVILQSSIPMLGVMYSVPGHVEIVTALGHVVGNAVGSDHTVVPVYGPNISLAIVERVQEAIRTIRPFLEELTSGQRVLRVSN